MLGLKAATFSTTYRHCQAKFSKDRGYEKLFTSHGEATTSTRVISALASLKQLTSHSFELVAFLPLLRHILFIFWDRSLMIRNLRLICDKKIVFMSSFQFTEYIMYSVHQWRNEVDFDAHKVSDHTRYHQSSRFLINVPSWMNINKYNFFTFLLPHWGSFRNFFPDISVQVLRIF